MIYFIQNTVTKAVKIGTSSDPTKRIASFQTAIADKLEIIGVIPGDRQVERKLHVRFSPHHIRGEWFRGDPELIRAVHLIIDGASAGLNVWEECGRRGCNRSGLSGVKVTVVGEHWVSSIRFSSWNAKGELVLHLEDTRQVLAKKCVLASVWPEPVVIEI